LGVLIAEEGHTVGFTISVGGGIAVPTARYDDKVIPLGVYNVSGAPSQADIEANLQRRASARAEYYASNESRPGLDVVAGAGGIWSSTSTLTSVENAYQHFLRHGAEFGFENSKQYVDATRAFISNPPPGTQIALRGTDKLLYNSATNTFAASNAAGVPKTMFRPTSQANYWLKMISAGATPLLNTFFLLGNTVDYSGLNEEYRRSIMEEQY
jgi:hypothetical protein